MKLTFLGTSAGESYPGIWCDCPNCTYAREHGGKNIRMNTGSMIDEDILLDMNSCGFYTAARLGVSLTGVKHLIITHPHADHNTIEPISWRYTGQGFTELSEEERIWKASPRFTELPMLTVYGSLHAKAKFVDPRPELFDGSMNNAMRFEPLYDGVEVDAGDGLTFIPVAARHGGDGYSGGNTPSIGKSSFTHNHIIKRGGKTLLYALDTGGYEDESLNILLAHKYDAVVMENTHGVNPSTDMGGHMSIGKNIAFRDLLLEKGCITKDTPVFFTHMSPHWAPPHDIYAPMMLEKGFIVAYDGLSVEI